MRTAGVIVEYNPFHNGHAYHLQKTLEKTGADTAVAVMSGHFLQRGEPALMDKWARARTALLGGVDLVLELPLAYSVQPAEWFAHGAISVLESTGVVDAFCFGSESGRLEPLLEAARIAADEPPELRERLAAKLALGLPYPKAYSASLLEYMTKHGGDSEFRFVRRGAHPAQPDARPSLSDLAAAAQRPDGAVYHHPRSGWLS